LAQADIGRIYMVMQKVPTSPQAVHATSVLQEGSLLALPWYPAHMEHFSMIIMASLYFMRGGIGSREKKQ
ncbi:hypothetical protein ACQP3J_32910, partial [Escherichia coli]